MAMSICNWPLGLCAVDYQVSRVIALEHSSMNSFSINLQWPAMVYISSIKCLDTSRSDSQPSQVTI